MVNKNIFITGATGFIGENLALKLAEDNKVFALVRRKSIKKAALLRKKKVEIIVGDLLDSGSFSKVLNDIDYVFHLAALFKLDAPKETLFKHNVIGTQKLLESCRDRNIKKIIHFSTAFVMGAKEKDLITEDEPYPQRFKNWYEWSKAESEKRCLSFCKRYDLPVVIARPVIVYGPKSYYGFYDALSLISKGKLWALPGNGRNKIHFVHVDDVVNAVIHLAGLENNSGKIYHISDDTPCSRKELLKFLCGQLGVKPPLLSLPIIMAKVVKGSMMAGLFFKDIPSGLLDYFLCHQTYSNIQLKSSGYSFKYPISFKGMEETINWYHRNNRLIKENKYVPV